MDKVALVTAGSQGIGAACARRLAKDGFKVAVLSRSEEAKKIAAEIEGIAWQGSVTSPSDLKDFAEAAIRTWNRIDVVINNTGHAARGELIELTDNQWQEGFEIYFMNVIRMARFVTPVMQHQGSGCIINISSFVALEPSLEYPVSSAIRAALANYVKLYSNRYAAHGIRMNNVLPGFVDSYPSDKEVIAMIPAHRQAKTSEVAGIVSFLASEEASYINGENIKIDGGLSRGF